MKHVALLIPTLDRIGGAERQVMLLAKGFAQRSWRVTVIALSGNGASSAEELRRAGVGFVSLEMRKGLVDPRGWFRLNRWLARNRPDVVHAHLPHAVWMARGSRLFARMPVLIDTIHTSAIGGWTRRFGYRISKWIPDRVTAVSHAVADAYLAAGMVWTGNLEVVPNGIDVQAGRLEEAERIAFRKGLGIGEEFLWLAVGRLEPVKDYPTLLRAMEKLAKPAHLMIAGSGVLEPALRDFALRLGLGERVHFLGFVPEMGCVRGAADGYVLSSEWEGLPMALLEAAACGLACVATDVPGTSETMTHGHTGLLAPPGDAEALAATMSRVMQMSADERRMLGESAQKMVAERYGLEAVLDRWERLYLEAMGSHVTPAQVRNLHSV